MNPYGSTQAERVVVTAEIDAGLKAHMNKVYGLMSVAMVLTGLLAYVFGMDLKAAMAGEETSIVPFEVLATLFNSPLKWVVMFGPLAMVFLFSAMVNKMSAQTATLFFMAFAAFMGISLSSIFVTYTGESIARVFFITAAAFAGLSIWGYTTKKDLSGWGTFLTMGVIGLVIASLVNMFLIESTMFQFGLSALGVLIFAGLTAYDTQNIKNTYIMMHGQPDGAAWLEKAAIMGALNLYLDFLNMFIMLLQLLGNRE